jgi:hypothetical protein
MSNHDPYSDPPEPLVVDKPQATRVGGADIVMRSSESLVDFNRFERGI